MARRVSLPAADDLFRRTTGEGEAAAAEPAAGPASARAAGRSTARAAGPTSGRAAPPQPVREVDPVDFDAGSTRRGRRPSGRVRHDEKMTVYVTAAELLEIEHARLALRSMHGLAVDRGRLVREAIAMALADLDTHGDDSQLVQRLTGR